MVQGVSEFLMYGANFSVMLRVSAAILPFPRLYKLAPAKCKKKEEKKRETYKVHWFRFLYVMR